MLNYNSMVFDYTRVGLYDFMASQRGIESRRSRD